MCDVVEISDDDEELPQFPLEQCRVDKRVSTASSESSQEDLITSSQPIVNSQDCSVSCADRRKAERETRRKEKEERIALREQQRLEKKQKKAKEKATNKAIKEVLKSASQDTRPGERVKHMVLHVDNGLMKRRGFVETLSTELEQIEVTYLLESNHVPNSVTWHRNIVNRTVNDDATIATTTSHQEEKHLLVVVDAGQLAQLVMNGRMEQSNSVTVSSPDHPTCRRFVESLQRGQESKRLSLAIVGLDAYERSLKTKHNRDFRKAVLSQGPLQRDTGSVDRADLEQSLIELELCTGCNIRKCSDEAKLVELVVQTTKSIAEAPFKRKNVFSFHDYLGPGPSKKDCTSQNKLSVIWQHQLLQFPNTGPQTAAAIADLYSTPCDLIKAYQACSSEEDAALLLQNIPVVRSTSRRLGPVLSRRIHRFLTATDGTTTLD